MTTHKYSQHFYDFVEQSSGRSAAKFIATLNLGYDIKSILDVGCGQGVWLRAWQEKGITDFIGIDGSYVDLAALQIPQDSFLAMDISQPFNLQRHFDLVECLEVAEHIPEKYAATLIASLTHHGDVILFSAATPGQGGEHHVNERPLEYWAKHFSNHGYQAFDFPRQATHEILEIEPWYRYNSILYANAAGIEKINLSVQICAQEAGASFKNMSPLSWRLRCFLIKLLPFQVTNSLAKIKHAMALRRIK